MPPSTLTRAQAHKIARELLQRERRLGDDAVDHHIVNLLLDALGVPDYPKQSFNPPAPDAPKDPYACWFGHEMQCTNDRQTKFFYAGTSYALDEELVGELWMCNIELWTPTVKTKGFNKDRSVSRSQAEDLLRLFIDKVAAIARELGISGEPKP